MGNFLSLPRLMRRMPSFQVCSEDKKDVRPSWRDVPALRLRPTGAGPAVQRM